MEPRPVEDERLEVEGLGRRVAEYRSRRGLSIEEVAARTNMSPMYLRVVEASPSARVSRAALWALASALDASIDTLAGGSLDGSPGANAGPNPHELEVLDEGACRDLVAAGGIGRLVYLGEGHPVAIPVNFGMLHGDVVFRTKADAQVVGLGADVEVSFEVDHVDDTLSEGWSVLLTGQVEIVAEPAELDDARALELSPWAGGDRPTYVRIRPRRVTGRRIRTFRL